MGEIARIGIAHGRKIPSSKLVPREGIAVETFVEKCLKELACGDIVKPILDGEPLSREQIVFLLRDAPVAVLAKLVEVLAGVSETVNLPRPMVMLPLESWSRASSLPEASDLAFRFLRAVPFSEIDVVIDWFDFSAFEKLVEIVEQISRRRPGVRFIGPSIEEIVSWLGNGASLDDSVTLKAISRRLDDFLFAMRKAGFYRMRFSVDLDIAEALDVPERLQDAGFVSVLGSPVDRLGGIHTVAADLARLSEVATLGRWDVWLPSVSHQFDGVAVKDPILDVRLLRMLAVGSLCLGEIPVRRASSSFLSLDGLSLARYFGANDLGYGGLDETTCNILKLVPYKTLMGAQSR